MWYSSPCLHRVTYNKYTKATIGGKLGEKGVGREGHGGGGGESVRKLALTKKIPTCVFQRSLQNTINIRLSMINDLLLHNTSIVYIIIVERFENIYDDIRYIIIYSSQTKKVVVYGLVFKHLILIYSGIYGNY